MKKTEKPDPEFIARQLRKPTGEFGNQVAEKMNQVNAPLYDLVLENMEPAKGDHILEIGFGNGKLFDKLFAKDLNIRVAGLDYSPEMVEEAREINRQAIVAGKLNLYLGDSSKLPFPDHTFDKVFCYNVIYFWDWPETHLKEIYRVLKPGGRFYAGARTKENMEKLPFIQYGFKIYDDDAWKSIVEKTGFEWIGCKKKFDPLTEFEGMPIQMESVCYMTGKM